MANGRSYTSYFKADSSGFKKGVDDMVKALEKANKELVNNQYRQKDCNKVISDAQKEIKKLEKEEEERVKQLEKETKRREELNQAITKAKSDIDNLNKSKSEDEKLTKEQEKSLKNLKSTIEKAQKELESLALTEEKKKKLDDEGREKIKKLNDTIESEKVKLAQLKTEQAAIKGTISDLSKEIAGNNKEWTTLKATIANLASDGLEALGRKLLEIGKSVIATGEQFTASMSEVGAISGATAEEMELLEQTAREYGATTKFSASESAQALKYMALAGWDTQQSIESLGSVLDLAAAGNMDLARASDIVTDYITAFGLSAQDSSHFVDVMAYAMSNSNTNVEQLGEAYKNCAAGAGAMGYSVEDVTAALMTMANAGIKGGEAGTSLNAVMTRLATDTKGCATALEEYGVYIYDSEGNMKSMSSILESLALTWQGLTQEEQANLGKMIAGQNQLNAFQTMMAGLSDKAKEAGASFSDYTKALEECDGTSEGMAKTMSDNLSGDLKTMQSAFEELALKIYDSGETPLRDLVKFVTNSVVPALDTLINHMDIIVPIFVAAATAVGSYKAALGIQSIIKGITQATTALTAAKTGEKVATDEATVSQAALNTVQAANPIGLVVSAIGLLVGALVSYSVITDTSARSTGEYADELNRAKKAIEECNDQLDSAKNHYSDTIANAQATAAQLDALGKEYEKLRTQKDKTEGQQLLMNNIAEQLAKSMGKNTEDLKDEAGKYRDLTDEIDKYIEKLKQQAEVQAATELYGDAVKTRTKASVEYAALESKAKDYYAQHKDELDEYVLLGGREGSGRITDVTKKFEEFRTELSSLKSVYDEASESVDLYADKVEETVQAQNKQAAATNSSGAALDGVKGKIEEVGDAVDDVQAYADKMLNGEEGYDLKGFYDLFRDTGEAADYLENRLTNANKALEDNRTEIKNTQDEIEKLRKELNKPDITDEDAIIKGQQLEEAKEKLAQLRTEQVGLKEDVKAAEKEYKKAAWDAKTLSEKLAEIAKTSSSVRNEMNSLAATFKELGEGQQMSLDALLSLTEKYPEYAAQILSATNNLNAQKDVIKLLYEEKKKALIESLKDAKDEIKLEQDKIKLQRDALQKQLEIVQAEYNRGNATASTARIIENLTNKLKALNDEFDSGQANIDAYVKAMAAVGNFSINSYGGNGNTNANNNYTPSQTSSSPATQEWTWGWMDEIGTGNTSAAARLSLVERVHQLGKINDKELKAEYEKILREEQLTADESYNIRQKLYSMTAQLRQKDLDLAKAAYEKLVKGQIETYQKASDNIKNDLDKKLKALDDESKKRQQKEEDEKRRKEIRDIEDEIFYNGRRMTQIEKDSLLRRKQDLLNEQAKADYERDLELKKTQLQEQANAGISKNTQAIERLNKVLEDASYYLAKISGSQSSSQIVNNSTRTQNIQYIAGGFGMSYDQFIRQIY